MALVVAHQGGGAVRATDRRHRRPDPRRRPPRDRNRPCVWRPESKHVKGIVGSVISVRRSPLLCNKLATIEEEVDETIHNVGGSVASPALQILQCVDGNVCVSHIRIRSAARPVDRSPFRCPRSLSASSQRPAGGSVDRLMVRAHRTPPSAQRRTSRAFAVVRRTAPRPTPNPVRVWRGRHELRSL